MSGPKVKQDTALPLLFDNRIRAMAAAAGPEGTFAGHLGRAGMPVDLVASGAPRRRRRCQQGRPVRGTATGRHRPQR